MEAKAHIDLERLNSATKYPSIPTFHRLGERGVPTADVQVDFGDNPVIFTEKIDGTNARLIAVNNHGVLDWFIGSREELLTAQGDRVANSALGIVSALRTPAEKLEQLGAPVGEIVVYYFEVFGGKVTAASKEYTPNRDSIGWRLFDVARVPPAVLDRGRDEIAAWRDSGGQAFLDETGIQSTALRMRVAVAPRLSGPARLPTDPNAVTAALGEIIQRSQVTFDEHVGGRPEGVVARTADRSVIAKLRFEDYARLNRKRRGIKE